MSKNKKDRRARRKFTREFKAEVVALCKVGDRSIAEVAKDLDLTETAVRAWFKQAKVDAGQSSTNALTTAEREELTHLRRENKRLQMEREILKKPSVARRISCSTRNAIACSVFVPVKSGRQLFGAA